MSYPTFDYDSEAYFPLGLPISREAWDTLDVASLLASDGATLAEPLRAIRRLADVMNRQGVTREGVSAGGLLVFGLIEDVMRYVADHYCFEHVPGLPSAALEWFQAKGDAAAIMRPCTAFVEVFPPQIEFADGASVEADYLEGITKDQPNRYRVARELALVALAMENPALRPFRALFDDLELKSRVSYKALVADLETFLAQQPPLPHLGQPLFDVLRGPMRVCPDSLQGQLEYIRMHWAGLLPRWLFERLVAAADVLKEETHMRGPGPGPPQVLRFGPEILGYPEPAAFTPDRDWMANVVLIAKNVHVWLDQLSKRYGQPLTRLDEIPDEELDRLTRWGFTGLWLIGVWERSSASQKIKQIMGNPEAAASAYSLYDYVIASDLGGEPAYDNLRERAWRRGIRLASDMVPNHVGIYSKWVVEHPDWFIQAGQAPFPVYQFTGTDLSEDERVRICIEDGYWAHGDAAVVFQRVDTWTGDTRYIYHGNDGTSMPWNDTAQLNFLLPEVREAVIQTILHVARKFPIIRFDAAMTLTKKHFQRLWSPRPGDGGAIPSRAERGMGRAAFDKVFPKEFWREVVDRVTNEVPETLLIAEAFWLMEGYFVRTLGMHRVYNSAFMNMLKMEDNAKYRQTIKNVLEFSPAVLERFVNFMNNPDERTAVDQFGKGDKYYGVAVLMVTMPGLPMFGHGQIEGFTEKYGMEYRKAYWDETHDEHMVHRHEAEVFPLMRKRHLFSGAENFALYDFAVPDGWVDENVFAYSNRCGDERALIVYNNAYNTTSGRICTSTAINVGDAVDKKLARRTLAEALGLRAEDNWYYAFRDHRTGLEYIRNARGLAEDGMQLTLQAYQYHAFLGFRAIEDREGLWGRLEAKLGGNGVPSVDEAYQELAYAGVLEPFATVVNGAMLRTVTQSGPWPAFEVALRGFLEAASNVAGVEFDAQETLRSIEADLESFGKVAECLQSASLPPALQRVLLTGLPGQDDAQLPFRRILVAWAILRRLDDVLPIVETPGPERPGLPGRPIRKIVAQAFAELGADDWAADMDASLVMLLVQYPGLVCEDANDLRAAALKQLFEDPDGQAYLQVNDYQGARWFRKEPMEFLVHWLTITAALASGLEAEAIPEFLANAHALIEAAATAGYEVDKVLDRFG